MHLHEGIYYKLCLRNTQRFSAHLLEEAHDLGRAEALQGAPVEGSTYRRAVCSNCTSSRSACSCRVQGLKDWGTGMSGLPLFAIFRTDFGATIDSDAVQAQRRVVVPLWGSHMLAPTEFGVHLDLCSPLTHAPAERKCRPSVSAYHGFVSGRRHLLAMLPRANRSHGAVPHLRLPTRRSQKE